MIGLRNTRRLLALFGAAALVVGVMAGSAAATPKDAAGEHTITICHVTNSTANPYVVIEVDVAAFDGQGANDHTHHLSKDGRIDVPFVDGVCQAGDDGNPTNF
jgi:ABC-type sugar transport system substrate-binding protein